MGYQTEAPVPTLIGEVPVRRRGLHLAGVPLVTGEASLGPLHKCIRRLQLIRAGVIRLKPVYVLAVRITLGYAVSVLDFLYSSHRCPAAHAARAQSALDATQSLPVKCSHALLCQPLSFSPSFLPSSRFRLRLFSPLFTVLSLSPSCPPSVVSAPLPVSS